MPRVSQSTIAKPCAVTLVAKSWDVAGMISLIARARGAEHVPPLSPAGHVQVGSNGVSILGA